MRNYLVVRKLLTYVTVRANWTKREICNLTLVKYSAKLLKIKNSKSKLRLAFIKRAM